MRPRFGLLGWRNPRPNDFQGPDQRPIKDALGNIEEKLTFPHVHLTITGGGLAAGGGLVGITFTERDDPYSLHDGTSNNIRVPADFNTWLAVGQASLSTAGDGGAGRRFVGWRINGVLQPFHNSAHFIAGGGIEAPYISAGCMMPVSKGQLIDVVASNSSAGLDTNVALELFLVFFPLA